MFCGLEHGRDSTARFIFCDGRNCSYFKYSSRFQILRDLVEQSALHANIQRENAGKSLDSNSSGILSSIFQLLQEIAPKFHDSGLISGQWISPSREYKTNSFILPPNPWQNFIKTLAKCKRGFSYRIYASLDYKYNIQSNRINYFCSSLANLCSRGKIIKFYAHE